jgi:hypothetical protein
MLTSDVVDLSSETTRFVADSLFYDDPDVFFSQLKLESYYCIKNVKL